jgi:hypothetical protein
MDYTSRTGGTTMRIKCKKRADGWIPVKGNEEEIIDFLWGQQREYFNNHDGYFVKLNDDGSIAVSDGQPSFGEYIAVPFSITDKDMVKILQAQNFVNLEMEHDGTIDTLFKNWSLKTTTKIFAVTYNDILIFNTDWEIVDCLGNDKNQLYRDILEANDYIVERDD